MSIEEAIAGEESKTELKLSEYPLRHPVNGIQETANRIVEVDARLAKSWTRPELKRQLLNELEGLASLMQHDLAHLVLEVRTGYKSTFAEES